MHLIVGLGNIGKQYVNTPHNAGFKFVESIYNLIERQKSFLSKTSKAKGGGSSQEKAQELVIGEWKEERELNSQISLIRDGGKIKYILAKPTTLMNLSGDAVAKIVSYYKLNPTTDLIVAYDDMDIELGKYKITFAKYPKTHNGVNDILKRYKNFTSIRIGIGKSHDIVGAEYVLSKLNRINSEMLMQAVDNAIAELQEQISN